MDFLISVEGDKELTAAFQKLLKKLSPDEVEPIVVEGATIIADAARQKAPLGKGHKKGGRILHLKDAIRATKIKRRGSAVAAIGTVDYRIAPHGLLVEYGSSHSAAHPYMRPAFDEKKQEVERLIVSEIGKKIEEAVR